ncbi:MAG: hypothetical protein HY696_11060 [Deltaproteobacteria bacterium]|nr:hypothetical protein [Deltaproteobacteria bacterium]
MAQPPNVAPPSAGRATPQTRGEPEKAPKTSRAQPREIRISDEDAIVVVGRIHKPEVMLLLGRTDPPQHALFRDRGKSFVPEIEKTVRKNPF